MNTTAQVRGGSIYTHTARFDEGQTFLSEVDLHAMAPSIFARNAHESVSNKYRPIATIDVLRDLAAEGFKPVGAVQSICRQEGRVPFAKHMLRLRQDDGIR